MSDFKVGDTCRFKPGRYNGSECREECCNCFRDTVQIIEISGEAIRVNGSYKGGRDETCCSSFGSLLELDKIKSWKRRLKDEI